MDDYDDELTKGRECKDLLASCGTAVPAKLGGCGSSCTTFVAKPGKLDDLQKKWVKEGCAAPACPREVCSSPLTSVCLAGVCSDLL